MNELLLACIFVLGPSWVIIAIATRYLDLLDHREERAQRRTADVVAIADKQAEMERVMDGAFAKHEARICELEVGGAVTQRRRP